MNSSPEFWGQLYENTPAVARWLFGIMTCGLLTLATYIWKRQNGRLDVIEKSYVKQKDFDYMREKVDDIHSYLLKDKK